jgi:transcriptional regulator with XRE-family HTH domain
MRTEHASPEVDGAKVRRLRKRARLTVGELASRLEIGPSYLSAIELERRRTVSHATYARICAVFGCEYDDLLRKEARAAVDPETAAAEREMAQTLMASAA